MSDFNRRLTIAVLALSLAGLAGPTLAATPTAPPVTAPTATQAWIRWLPGNLPLAGYVTLKNPAREAKILVSASSPVFKRIEFHHSMEMDGMSHMQAVDSVTVPAQGEFKFAPGAYHLMMWRKESVKVGDRVPVTFVFADAATLRVVFTVRGAAG